MKGLTAYHMNFVQGETTRGVTHTRPEAGVRVGCESLTAPVGAPISAAGTSSAGKVKPKTESTHMKNTSLERLQREIVALSKSDEWAVAREEWTLDEVQKCPERSTCLCGHSPIKYLCILRNHWNDNRAVVGSVCVQKFMGLPTGRIFFCLARIEKDKTKALNPETIAFALRKGWINEWDRRFALEFRWKRKLTPAIRDGRIRINGQVLDGYYGRRVRMAS